MKKFTLMSSEIIKKAFSKLDSHLNQKTNLVLGGGAAMAIAYRCPLATHDVDAILFKCDVSMGELTPHVEKVAKELHIPLDWLNPYFETFTYVLPSDFGSRLKVVFKGKHLTVFALSTEDLLILKCFAGREKDIGHARILVKKCKNIKIVDHHLQKLIERNIPKAQRAADFFDELKDRFGM